jgi:hypothetical protein
LVNVALWFKKKYSPYAIETPGGSATSPVSHELEIGNDGIMEERPIDVFRQVRDLIVEKIRA